MWSLLQFWIMVTNTAVADVAMAFYSLAGAAVLLMSLGMLSIYRRAAGQITCGGAAIGFAGTLIFGLSAPIMVATRIPLSGVVNILGIMLTSVSLLTLSF